MAKFFQPSFFQTNFFQTDTQDVTDTNALQNPVNCVMIGQQLYRNRYRETTIVPKREVETTAVSGSRRSRLKGTAPSFTVRTDKKGYH